MKRKIKIIGGGLAGCEAAYQLLKRGYEVDLYEMRPKKNTPIHKTSNLAELVCSNSLKSTDEKTSQGLLKYELRVLDSLILRCAEQSSVPAGGALAVDREQFSQNVEKELSKYDKLNIIREENAIIDDYTIVATGPLSSDGIVKELSKLIKEDSLYFYDAVAPIVTAESIDKENSFFAGRYGKGGDDYLNCPLSKEEYYSFVNELINADTVILHDFEKKEIFNACMPVELIAKSGVDSLRFGPLRPVGLCNPKTNERPYAVVQLRKEDNYDRLYNIVGFQTNMKFGEQKRVFSMIPALKDAEFVRYGVMHRNTYVNAPKVLTDTFTLKANDTVFLAGQISGVEGYLESTMSGLMCGINMARMLENKEKIRPSERTVSGSLMKYLSTENKNFQPMHVSFSLIEGLETHIKDKKLRKQAYSERAKREIVEFFKLQGE